MFRYFVLLSFTFFFAFNGKGQSHIKGKILGKDSLPLPFASVSIIKESKELSQQYADSLGRFDFAIAEATHNLRLVATYLKKTSDTIVASQFTDGSAIYINIGTPALQNVTVRSQKPLIQRTEDRIIYNIEGNAAFENKPVVDLFKSIPRVTVSGFNIGITGQGLAAVMINNRIVYMTGKELIDYLSIFRTEIASIEVIPNPPAKYEAEGGGIINIVTKRGRATGFFGDIQSVTTRNSYWQQDGFANLRYRNKNLNVALGLSYGQGDYKETIRQSYVFLADQSGWFDRASNKNHYDNAGANLAIDYQISKRSSINATVGFTRFKSNNRLSRSIFYQFNSLTDSLGATTGNDLTSNKLFTVSTTLHKDLKSRKGSWDFSADIFRKSSTTDLRSTTINKDGNTEAPTGTVIDLLSSGDAPRNIFSLKWDITLPAFFFKWNTELGLKYTHFDNHSDVSYDQLINDETIFPGIVTSDRFSYQEDNVAAYFQIGRQLKKWQLKTGLRYEGTFTKGHSDTKSDVPNRRFHNLFPSAFVQYKLSDDDNIGISYSRRISRPRIWDINPYRWYSNIYSFSAGNPYLTPAYQNNVDLSLTINNKFFTSIYYNRQQHPILTLPFNSGLAIENRKLNSGRISNYGITMDLNLNPVKILQSSFGVVVGSYSFKTPYQYSLPKKPLIITFNTNQSIDISSSFSAALNFSAAISGGGYNISRENGSYKLDFSTTKTFFKNRFEIRLAVEDIFKSSSPEFSTSTPVFLSKGYNYYDFRYVSLGLKHKFGKALRVARTKSGILGTEKMRL
ncbi:MAG: outer membrane beta-barrel family protein [Chitinophagaceae bacterium]